MPCLPETKRLQNVASARAVKDLIELRREEYDELRPTMSRSDVIRELRHRHRGIWLALSRAARDDVYAEAGWIDGRTGET